MVRKTYLLGCHDWRRRDTIRGSNTNDTLKSGARNDIIFWSEGSDSIDAGADLGVIDYSKSMPVSAPAGGDVGVK